METNKQPIYPVEPWNITETSFSIAGNYRNETTFALSNGYIGTRGTYEEAYGFTEQEGLEGNFINGFYESEDIRYGEWNFGFPTKSQSLLNLPDLKSIRLMIDGEPFDMRTGTLEEYCRTLDMKEGVVSRKLLWTSPSGKTIRLEAERFVSLAQKNLMAMVYTVTPVNFDGQLTLTSALDADVENHTRTTNPLVDYGPFGRHLEPDKLYRDGDLLYYQGHTKNSGLSMACGAVHVAEGVSCGTSDAPEGVRDDGATCADMCRGDAAGASQGGTADTALSASLTFTGFCHAGAFVRLTKYIIYTSCLDMATEELENWTKAKLAEVRESGYQNLKAAHSALVHDFWNHADVVIEGDDALQQGIRFNLWHIMQAAGRDGKTGMGAKGLSGEGYEGHYFWDTEMYVLPVFAFTAPDIARKLLDYRYYTLGQARDRARVLGHPIGALYPWRTINGEEASTYFPLGTAQYHINGDIAYAFHLYVDVTGDEEYLRGKAAEVFCETARVWADVGCFAESKSGRYCICAVTGPDEYNAIVDNNFYTNLMARENLRYAIDALKLLKDKYPDDYETLALKIGLDEEEPMLWQKIADNMYFPYDEARGVYPLDDGFLMRKPWDDSKIPPEKRHLLYENYHPLFVYRQRMSKQADAILGMMLHSNYFTKEELKRNYDFYQEVTLHHSSLSTCIFGILACQIGYSDEAYDYFAQSARMDLDDYHENFYAGIHAANMAGTWQAIVFGFAGLKTNTGVLKLDPVCPKAWKGYRFRFLYRESLLEVSVCPEGTAVTLLNQVPASFLLGDTMYQLQTKGDCVNHETI